MSCGNPNDNLTNLNQEILSGPTATTFGGTTSVKCKSGYKWIDGSVSKTINCSAAGRWNFPASCSSMFHNRLIFHLGI